MQCTDAPWPTDWSTVAGRTTRRWRRKAPFETWANAWYNAPCAFWPVKPGAGKPVKIDGSKLKSLLLISETLDGATPYEGALEARRVFPHSALVEGVGRHHARGVALDGNECVNDHVADYLANGTLPKRKSGDSSDAQCAPLPQPTPTALAVS